VNLIGHENIVGIYDLSVLPNGRYFFVMEYLEGETLQALLQAGPPAPLAAKEVLLQLCEALQRAHDRGVVHRDMKPDNVFLVRRRGKSHFVKIVDFGIAKLRDAGRPGSTAPAGLIIGTPEYMAPEQCEDGAVDARTDVYALGVMAFELATGRLPFEARSVAQLLLAHLQKAPPRPSSLAPVPPALERAILRAMEKDPAKRFADMAAFAAALREASVERVVVGAPAAAAAAAATPVEPPPPEPPLAVDVRTGAGAPERAQVVELTRGGMFLRAAGDAPKLPPLLSRVAVGIRHPSLRARLEVAGEVVRHVLPEDAAAWGMSPGFAVQFVDLAPEARAALAALADERRPAGKRSTLPPATAAAADERLRALEERRGGTHYDFLGLSPAAEFADVRRAVRAVREELETLRMRPLAADHPARTTALLARLDAANAALGTPTARLAYDAQRGNALGVSRCITAGIPAALVAARRAALLAAHPERAAAAGRQVARAHVARKLRNAEAALAAYEAALAADPLDLETLAAYLAYRGEREKG
jgi:serine/threonine-protein kinase